MTGYVYNSETRELLVVLTGTQDRIEQYVTDNYDGDTCGMTYSPAFGTVDGLIDTGSHDRVDI